MLDNYSKVLLFFVIFFVALLIDIWYRFFYLKTKN